MPTTPPSNPPPSNPPPFNPNPSNTERVSDPFPRAQEPAREIRFESGEVRLFAAEVGAGRPLVFVHGGLADHRAALFRIGALAETHRLVLPDLRGSGRSIYSGTLSWDLLADDLVSLLDHLGIERAVVGGTSMGSAVAVRFALRHPSRLSGLVLMSPLYPGADRPLPEAASAAMQRMAEAGERTMTEGVAALRPLFETLPSPVREVALRMMLGFDAGSVRTTTRFLATNAQPMASARALAAIDARVILLPGVDAQHPAEIAALYAGHLRDSVLIDQSAPDCLEQIGRLWGGRGGHER